MVSIDTDTNSAESVQTVVLGNLRLLLPSVIFLLLFFPAISFAAEKSDYSVFDYIIAFVIGDILLSIVWYLIKK